MLPPFDENGCLPSGIHWCELAEIVTRFGSGSPERQVETQELLAFVEWARRASIRRILVNGSYVSDKEAPNDVEIVILPSPEYPRGERPYLEEESRWPFLQVLVAVDDEDFAAWALEDFATDRNRLRKGVIEVIL